MLFKYFRAPFTPDNLKQQFKDQSKVLHPDMPGGDKEKFQDMQNEFDRVLIFARKAKKFKRARIPGSVRTPMRILWSMSEEEKQFLRELRDLASITVRNKIIEELKRWST